MWLDQYVNIHADRLIRRLLLCATSRCMNHDRTIREFVSGTRELSRHIRRLWPDQADALLSGPAIKVVEFLNANTPTQIDGKAPLSFIYWLPALRKMPTP